MVSTECIQVIWTIMQNKLLSKYKEEIRQNCNFWLEARLGSKLSIWMLLLCLDQDPYDN